MTEISKFKMNTIEFLNALYKSCIDDRLKEYNPIELNAS